MNTIHVLLSWIKKDQLISLGLSDQQFDFILAFFLLIMLYIIVKPIITILIRLKWYHLSAYVITMLLFSNFISLYRLNQMRSLSESSLLIDNMSLFLSIFTLGVAISLFIIAERILSYFKLVKKQSN
ncbi:uncharacterized membrane protein (UPF0182 family) [Natronobacillus azotifigens]|uniref:Uncharacterized protein n=1 Tax=Natronobacillus azotifigens TaxID=472978 RepID=A0A9J6RE64_9BACI|nr:hypothetical protein [Natronobacillus azotifigens]MCZ0703952.1 hypothetical protein [Natronobacillus azotifigens]